MYIKIGDTHAHDNMACSKQIKHNRKKNDDIKMMFDILILNH